MDDRKTEAFLMPKHPKRALTEAELQRMREACGASKRDLALFEFLRSTGCRAHEMLFTRIEDVDIENKRVFLRKTKAKIEWAFKDGKRTYKGSKVVPRTSFFDDIAAKAVAEYIDERRAEGAGDEDQIFTIDQNAECDGWMTRHIVKGLAKAAKIPDWKHISPHYLRHSRATLLNASGYPTNLIKETMGWSQKSLTFETVYTHPDVDMMQKLHKKMVEHKGE